MEVICAVGVRAHVLYRVLVQVDSLALGAVSTRCFRPHVAFVESLFLNARRLLLASRVWWIFPWGGHLEWQLARVREEVRACGDLVGVSTFSLPQRCFLPIGSPLVLFVTPDAVLRTASSGDTICVGCGKGTADVSVAAVHARWCPGVLEMAIARNCPFYAGSRLGTGGCAFCQNPPGGCVCSECAGCWRPFPCPCAIRV